MHCYNCIAPQLNNFEFKPAAVNIGFLAPLFFTMENESATAMVCAQIDQGNLEREVTVVAFLSTIPGGTAERKQNITIRNFS
jgi:hypothetical protein